MTLPYPSSVYCIALPHHALRLQLMSHISKLNLLFFLQLYIFGGLEG